MLPPLSAPISPDPYRVLGVSELASTAEIKAACRALVKRHHPDAGGDDQTILALNAAWEGFGTDEQATSRILGRWSKHELKKICAAYEAKYGKSVQEGIESETSGNYKKALLAYLFTDMPHFRDPEPVAAQVMQ